MKRLIIYFIILTFAILIGLAISMHSGYVLIAYKNTLIETTLWIALFALLCGFLIFYGLLRSGANMYHLPQTISNFIKQYRQHKLTRYSETALQKFLENDIKKTERALIKSISIKNIRIPLANYLALAYLANKQHGKAKGKYYLDLAQKSLHPTKKTSASRQHKNQLFMIALTHLHLLMENQQYEEALALICHLRHTHPKHKLLLSQLTTIYCNQQDWHSLRLLLPLLFRCKTDSKVTLLQLEKKVYLELWRACLKIKNVENIEEKEDKTNIEKTEDDLEEKNKAYKKLEKKIKEFWRKLPRYLRHDADIVNLYITYLEKNIAATSPTGTVIPSKEKDKNQAKAYLHRAKNAKKQAEKLILKALDKNWQPKLIEHYGIFVGNKPWQQLRNMESWLQAHEGDTTLLLALGRICKRQMLWGKAKYYLEQYLKVILKTPELNLSPHIAYKELAEIAELLDDQETALKYYRQGLKEL